jgi:outer membrane protein assembly factor BamB
LVAFDRMTGAFRWRFVPAIGYGPGIYLGQATPTLVFAGSPAGRVYAISSLTGDLVWSTAIAADGRTTVFPPATDGRDVAVVFTTFTAPPRGGVALLELATGRELWRKAFPIGADPLLGTGSAGGPVLTDSFVVASSGDGTIHAFDRRHGTAHWVAPPVAQYSWPSPETGPQPPPPMQSADHRPLGLVGGLLVSGSLSSYVVAYDLVSGRERWRHLDRPSGSVAFALSTDEQYVYVPYVSGRHVALDVATGTERWRTESRDGFSWPAGALDDRVYLAGTRGGFVACQR